MQELGVVNNSQNFKKYNKLWWKNTRKKSKGGMWLTDKGFEDFQKAQIKNYCIKFANPLEILENEFIIWLDNYLDSPFYLTKKELYTFGERTAVQMMLFSGDIKLWHNAYKKNRSKIS